MARYVVLRKDAPSMIYGVSANPRSEPIEHGGEWQEAQKMISELFMAGGDTAVAFDPSEEVFDGVALPVQSAAEPTGSAPARPGWNGGPHALSRNDAIEP